MRGLMIITFFTDTFASLYVGERLILTRQTLEYHFNEAYVSPMALECSLFLWAEWSSRCTQKEKPWSMAGVRGWRTSTKAGFTHLILMVHYRLIRAIRRKDCCLRLSIFLCKRKSYWDITVSGMTNALCSVDVFSLPHLPLLKETYVNDTWPPVYRCFNTSRCSM